jgi:hypothetical protein
VGYSVIPFWPFALGTVIVAVPAALMEGESRKWATGYVFLILLMFAVFHWQGLSAASGFVQRELRKGKP